MEEFEDDGQSMIRLNLEEADYFIARSRLNAAKLRLSMWVYVLAVQVVGLVLLFNILMLYHGSTGSIGPIAVCLFWVGFFLYRAWGRKRDARRMEKVADRLLQEIGKEEIRRALEGET